MITPDGSYYSGDILSAVYFTIQNFIMRVQHSMNVK